MQALQKDLSALRPVGNIVSHLTSFQKLGKQLLHGKQASHWQMIVNSLSLEGDFCGHLNQSFRYVYSCLDLIFLILTSTNNPSPKSVVLESSAKPGLVGQGTLWARYFQLRAGVG